MEQTLGPGGAPASPSERRGREDAPALTPGHVVANSYRLKREIARGGMGALFEGEDLTGHRVAIKVILADAESEPRTRQLFEKEAIALRSVQHEAVVRYHALLQDDWGRLFLVMEYVDGEPLSRYVREAHLSTEGVFAFAARLASGLAAAHAVGVVHRDIAPKNILLPGGRVEDAVIVDFGIARQAAGDGFTISGDGFVGTMRYATPEQHGLFGGRASAQTDMYALAVVMAEVAGYSLEGVGMPRDVTLPTGADPALRARLEPMLKADPAQRPKDIVTAWVGPLDTPGDRPVRLNEPRRSSVGTGWLVGAAFVVMAGCALAAVLVLQGLPSGGSAAGPGAAQVQPADVDPGAGADPSFAQRMDEAKAKLASGGAEEMNEAYSLLLRLSKDGLSEASLKAGELLDPNYYSPAGSPFTRPNTRRALQFYKAAAEQGSAEARSRILRLEAQ